MPSVAQGKARRARVKRVPWGAAGEAKAALVENAYGIARRCCEVVVDQELLVGVTQRYQPNVMMTRPMQVEPEKFAAARDVISPMFRIPRGNGEGPESAQP